MDAGRQRTRRIAVAGRYDLLRVIDHGGYAIVYEAEDTKLGRTVALKTILPGHPDPAAGPRLQREARVMASITHPNVCGVSDVGTLEDGRPFFVMDRLQGETLRSLLNRELVVDAELAIDFCIELLSALHAVHAEGSVHRDVKPENIFLAQRSGCGPAVKLLDFGCCGPMAARESDDHLTRDFHVVGTAAYMAPEQAAGSRLFHAGTDIFAAALVLLESLTGFERQPPSQGAPEVFPTLSHFRSDLPPALSAILARALSPDPRQRYRSTAAFAKDLREVRALFREGGSAAGTFAARAPKTVATARMFVPACSEESLARAATAYPPAARVRTPEEFASQQDEAPTDALPRPPSKPTSRPPLVRMGSYAQHIEPPTEAYRRMPHVAKPPEAAKAKSSAPKDTLRDSDDDTPHTPMRFPLDVSVRV